MSSRHRLRRLAVATAACIGMAGLGAGPAAAGEVVVKCEAAQGYASGASLLRYAMENIWLTAGGWGGSAFQASGYTECEHLPFAADGPNIDYNSTSSGEGLNEFGNNSGELEPANDPVAEKEEKGKGVKDTAGRVLDWFVGTDDPPTAGQNGEAKVAAGAKNDLAEITIPVAQAPIAVLLSLPAGCRVEEGSKLDIENRVLGQLWEGLNKPSGADPGGIQAQGGYAANTWGAFLAEIGYTKVAKESELEEDEFYDGGTREEELPREKGGTEEKVKVKDGGCEEEIKPQVNASESGTSYAFKTYLEQTNSTVWNGYADDLANWPSGKVLLEDPRTSGNGVEISKSNGRLAENTAANPGSIGYADVVDAAESGGFTGKAAISQKGTGKVAGAAAKSIKHQIAWAEIQDNGLAAEPNPNGYADPIVGGLGGAKAADCETGNLVPGDEGFPTSYNDSWAGLTSTDPNLKTDAGVADYSICALTYDLAWHHYQVGNLFGKTKEAEEVAAATHNVLEYIITQGQADIQGHYYQRFPTAMLGHVKIAVAEVKY
jgi:ABC-type phosphate transport system substrate-binding protein